MLNTFEEEKGRERMTELPAVLKTKQTTPLYPNPEQKLLTPLVGFFDGHNFLGKRLKQLVSKLGVNRKQR